MAGKAKPKAIAYIDGFNLYYSGLKNTSYKWLNIYELLRVLFLEFEITKIYYCTAKVTNHPGDPDQSLKQSIYFRALGTLPQVEIVYGQFKKRIKKMPKNPIVSTPPEMVEVVTMEEKGSDVNIATLLLCDGYEGNCDVAIVVSNDTDLVLPIQTFRDRINKPIYVACPVTKWSTIHQDMINVATGHRSIRTKLIAKCLFTDVLTDAIGSFSKPSTW